MRFLFVDKIIEQTKHTIAGARHFTAGEPLRYVTLGGDQRIAPGIISEAIGQLASWKCINDNDFSARPVFLFADKIRVFSEVRPGSTLELRADIHEVNSETVRFSGQALCNGTVVQAISDCSGYFLPLAELEDPGVTRSRYRSMTNGGIAALDSPVEPYSFFNLIEDSADIVTGKSIHARVKLSQNEPFYADHFPRMPVTPIVVLNELIGAASCMLQSGKKERCLSVRRISGIKIRSFVRPGDEIEIKVIAAGSDDQSLVNPGTVETIAEIFCKGKRILRGSFTYLDEEWA